MGADGCGCLPVRLHLSSLNFNFHITKLFSSFDFSQRVTFKDTNIILGSELVQNQSGVKSGLYVTSPTTEEFNCAPKVCSSEDELEIDDF